MSKEVIQPGKFVSMTYSIREESGDVVEQHDLPVGFVFGSETELLGGMDKALQGHVAGDSVEVKVPSKDAFGAHDPALTFIDTLENVPEQFRHVGAEVQMQNDRGETKTFFISHLGDKEVTIDGNHPLAGKDLVVRITVLEVRDALPGEEKNTGIHSTQMNGPTSIN